jgi:endonuclease III related protein
LLAGPLEVLARLSKSYGDLGWWPVDKDYHAQEGSDPRFEIVVGAILTQNTTWTSVEQALRNLKAKKLLAPKKMHRAGLEVVREAIRPAGSYNQKANYIMGLAKYFATTYKDGLDPFFAQPTKKLREILLSFSGMGPETTDDVLVYAAKRPVFVVDAYARRLTKRLGWGTGEEPYETLQEMWSRRLGTDAATYAAGHGLIVEHCKTRCTHKAPACPGCPLEPVCARVGVEPTAYLKAAQSGNVAKPPR